jgi:hypothetical protein
MKAVKFIVAGGLVLTLGAFGPTLARAQNGNNNPNNANYSDNSGANDSQKSAANNSDNGGMSDSQNSTANNPADNAPTATVPENENQSSEANQNPVNPQYENENTAPFHPSNQAQSQEEQGNENSAATQPQNQQQGEQQGQGQAQPNAKLSQEQSHIGRMIYRLDRDLSDAETYEAAGREDWSNNDVAGAERNFHTAEHILRMATGGASFGPAFFGQNPHQQEMVAEKALKEAKKAGANVSDAQAYLDQGKQALNKGHDAEASRDFRAAELALGIPVEVGYAEVWEAEVPVRTQNRGTAENQQGEPQTENGPVAMAQPNNNWGEMNGARENSRNIGDAQMFLRAGEQALANGDQAQAQRDFRAADRALSMNESSRYTNSR